MFIWHQFRQQLEPSCQGWFWPFATIALLELFRRHDANMESKNWRSSFYNYDVILQPLSMLNCFNVSPLITRPLAVLCVNYRLCARLSSMLCLSLVAAGRWLKSHLNSSLRKMWLWHPPYFSAQTERESRWTWDQESCIRGESHIETISFLINSISKETFKSFFTKKH